MTDASTGDPAPNDVRTGGVVWITGVPASGKTTLARGLLDWLSARNVVTLWLDSDDLRGVITAEDYSDKGRDAFYSAIGHIARLGADGGALVVVSATASRASYRDAVREAVPAFVEVYLTCDPAVLRDDRDIKGLYASAAAGELKGLPGVDALFEAPSAAELCIDTTTSTRNEVLERVLRWLEVNQPQLV